MLLVGLVMLAGCAKPADLEVTQPRVRALIPGQDTSVAYFTARNNSAASIVLTGASSPSIRAIEMHTTIHDDGMVRMRRLAEVEIPPGETVRFEPGGRHLMLFGVTELGASTEILLRTQSGATTAVDFVTMALADQPGR